MRIVAIFVLVSLSGCSSGMGYLATNYGVEAGEVIQTKDGEYRVWDHAADGRILVSPTVSQLLSQPISPNAGIVTEGGPREGAARNAALAWFKQSGRECAIKSSREVARPEFELTYACK
jgi:hypothetical protein